MSELITTNGLTVQVSPEDLPWLSQYTWYAARRQRGNGWHVMRSQSRKLGRKNILMHREIMCVSDERKVDHANLDTLDMRRENLRIATNSEQQCNKPVTRRNKLGVKGVYLHTRGIYRSYIMKDRKRYDLGTFRTIAEASAAYNEAAIRLHGEFARLGVCHS